MSWGEEAQIAAWRRLPGARRIAGLVSLLLCAALPALLPAAHGATIKVPLRNLTAQATMELRCVSDAQHLEIPVPERWEIRRMVAHIRYAVSTNVISETSQLVFRVNDVPIAQTRLDPQAPDVRVGVSIPLEYLEPGYNRLTFQVVQHFSRKECEAPCAPDLWTEINLRESYIEFDYALKPVPLKLSALSGLIFDPRLLPQGDVNVISEDLSASRLTIASVVASGIARRFDYRNVAFNVSSEIRKGMDNVLIGRRAFVEQFLDRHGVSRRAVEGGYLRLVHLPDEAKSADRTHALLVVSGEDENAVRTAAVTFANLTFPFPGGDELKAYEFTLPELAKYSGRQVLTAGRAYDFRTLDFPTYGFKGFNPGPRNLSFRLPVDFHIRPNQFARLELQFAYGAGLNPDSSLNVSVNGRGVRAIPLNVSGGGFIERYYVDIPTYVFRPGVNTIGFAPHFAMPGQICDLIQPEGLFLTLFENSTLRFPDMPHFVEMPRIELFMYNGFPFTRWPDGFETTVLLGEEDPRLAAAALNLVGLMTQKNGFPLFGLQYAYGKPPPAGELLVLGRIETLPEELRRAALPRLEPTALVPYPVIRAWESEITLAYSRQSGGLGTGRALLSQFQSPYQAGRTVLMLAAERHDDLLAASVAMLDPGAQAKSHGDLVLIELAEPEPKVTALKVGANYITGEQGRFAYIESFFYTRPEIYYSAIGLLVALLGLALYAGLRRYRAKRNAAKQG